ncbi:hypothetical protein V7D15_07180 [Thermoanaerobacter thermohydrosulfuricus]
MLETLKEKASNLYKKAYVVLSDPLGLNTPEILVWTGLGILIAWGVLGTMGSSIKTTTSNVMNNLTQGAVDTTVK